MQRIVMVGSGHLAHALWEGWNRTPIDAVVDVVARSTAHRHLWDGAYWDRAVSFEPARVAGADVVVLTVKPKDMEETLARIQPYLDESAIVISPVAGWTMDRIRSLGVGHPLVRIMPNVCAAVGASTTLAAFSGLTAEAEERVLALLRQFGTVTVIEESLMDPYTALLGSGPAYIFLLLEALIAGGEKLGADAERTRDLVSRMVEGAARLARDRSDDPLSDWISMVASPGGTTEALLQVLEQGGWPTMIQDAVVAASQRAEQLGEVR
ncbi:pyrroline-5-carboxylate reductase family protein [Sulfobacillus harzensis]|uniref:Pyrroline-5-carboxylate reductase n=1 Tax=Sulfobacillus harzensis TaxID=2729629 RepID=A0A7Y0Q1U7_9FIRM|nr:pyrroline-5-carboxylate reductase [Sulfobacillus harzensis]NMP21695.1 pyrroline-5-carboxylate reductase [Sulfobacillus harzensis]